MIVRLRFILAACLVPPHTHPAPRLQYELLPFPSQTLRLPLMWAVKGRMRWMLVPMTTDRVRWRVVIVLKGRGG